MRDDVSRVYPSAKGAWAQKTDNQLCPVPKFDSFHTNPDDGAPESVTCLGGRGATSGPKEIRAGELIEIDACDR